MILIIDFHVHCFRDDIAKTAIQKLAESGDIRPFLDGTASDLLRSMDSAGIDISFIMPIATKAKQTVNINNWAGTYSSGRLISFGTIHPGFDEWESELLRIHGMGLKGIKFHPEYQCFDVDDPSMFPIYGSAIELGMILLFHAGNDIAFEPPCHCPPEKLAKVINRFPDAKIVAAHMGGYDLWDDVLDCLAGSPVYLDTSMTLGFIDNSLLFKIIERHGADRILFGTDSPWTDQGQQLAAIRSLGLDADTVAMILGGNAEKLLGINGEPI
jgi:predicted TIM-barrel fold metal-dependent hydrolase